ncbi:MAG TPA: hypothetical protein DCF44_06325 [Chitinophagaceae bacterium]|nr:hypothetical protein [Chitinophagaceae bacterium]
MDGFVFSNIEVIVIQKRLLWEEGGILRTRRKKDIRAYISLRSNVKWQLTLNFLKRNNKLEPP